MRNGNQPRSFDGNYPGAFSPLRRHRGRARDFPPVRQFRRL